MVVAASPVNVGTTVAPWMQFYMQSAVIEKRLKIEDYKYTLADVLVGCILTIVVAFFIMVACGSTLHVHGVRINDASDANARWKRSGRECIARSALPS